MKTIQYSILILAAMSLAGCVSGYASFYQPVDGASPSTVASLRVGPPPVSPQIERARPGGDPDALMASYAKRGYVLIGTSSFNSGRAESADGAIKQAKAVGADLVVVLDPQYTGSVTSSIPITTPTSSTSYTTGSATAYGPGGPVTAYGNATTTTYGSTTNYIPMTIHRSDYGALYFVKQRFRLGLFVRDLNEDERLRYETNRGVVVRLVVDDTPAFDSDILPGDIVESIDGVRVSNEGAFQSILEHRGGKSVSLTILRNGQRIEKTVQLRT